MKKFPARFGNFLFGYFQRYTFDIIMRAKPDHYESKTGI